MVRDLLADHLEVLEAPSGIGALELIQSRHVDVVLLDLLMPGLDGLEVLLQLRTLRTGTKVIVMSGLDYAQTAAAAFQGGALDYITKPFDTRHLLALVKRVVLAHESAHDSPGTVLLLAADLGRRAALVVLLAVHFEVRTAASPSDVVRLWPPDRPALLIIDAQPGAHVSQPIVNLAGLGSKAHLIVIGEGEVPVLDTTSSVRIVHPRPCDYARLLEDSRSLLRGFGSGRPLTPISPTVSKAIDHIGYLYRETTAETIAATVHLSPSRLSKLFRAQLGMGVKQYLTKVRIEVAKSLLRDTDQKVEVVAKRAGFHDSSHLSRVLQRQIGCSPTSYRRESRSLSHPPTLS